MDITLLMAFLAIALLQVLAGLWLYTRIERTRDVREIVDRLRQELYANNEELKTMYDGLVKSMRGLLSKLEELENIKKDTKESLNLSQNIIMKNDELKIILIEVFKSTKEFLNKLTELENIEMDTRNRLKEHIDTTYRELSTRMEGIHKETINSLSQNSGELKTMLDSLIRNMKELSGKLTELENIEMDTRNRLKEQIDVTYRELITILKRIEEPISIDKVFSHDKKQ